MWYIVRLDSSRVATLVKVRSATLVSSSDPTRVKSNYIPVETTSLRQIERCSGGRERNTQLDRCGHDEFWDGSEDIHSERFKTEYPEGPIGKLEGRSQRG